MQRSCYWCLRGKLISISPLLYSILHIGHLNMDMSEALLKNIINFEGKKEEEKKIGRVWNNLKLLAPSS